MNTLSTHQEFDRLRTIIATGDWGLADPWRGADVAIVEAAPVPADNAWFHDDVFVITPHVRELSWLFEQARNIVWDHDDYGMFKYEYFGRMGEAVAACGPDAPITTHLNVALFAARFFVESVLNRR